MIDSSENSSRPMKSSSSAESRPVRKLSVIIGTYNRAHVLRRTLQHFSTLRTDNFEVEWIVVDNNSTDSTRETMHEFSGILPLIYLFQPRPGRNAAINKAIDECELGDIVVFTDDDILPASDWLVSIHRSSGVYPQHSVFGGRIFPLWPNGVQPVWARDVFTQMFHFGLHDLGASPMLYPKAFLPFAGNLWMRRRILEQGFRFNEDVGPRPKFRISGGETTFLKSLRSAGYDILFYPDASVEHIITEDQCRRKAVWRRSLQLGRGEVYASGLPRPELRERFPLLWYGYLMGKLGFAMGYWGLSMALPEPAGTHHGIDALRVLGNSLESLRTGFAKNCKKC